MRPSLYDKFLEAPGRIRANLDIVSEAGTVEGWALYEESPAVCHIQVRLGGVVLGEDMADKFRADLLSAGLRYGHCAFYVVIPITRPGHYPLELVDGRTGERIDQMSLRETYVPALTRKPDRDLVHATWTDEQVLGHLSCLHLDMNFERMGAERFVDAVFRFALGRWADSAALDSYGGALHAGSMTPTSVLRVVMTSEERKAQERALPSPFGTEFAFDIPLL